MKILLLNYEYPPLGGGAGVASEALVQSLMQEENLSIDIVTSALGKGTVEKLNDRITIHRLNIGKTSNPHYQSLTHLLTYAIRSYRYAKHLSRENSYDLCHAFFGIPCGAIAERLNLPTVISLRGSDVPFHNPRYYWLDRFLFQRLSRGIWQRAKIVTVNSPDLEKEANLTLKRAYEYIPNGVDTTVFTAKQQYSIQPILRVVFTGRLTPIKGLTTLIKASSGLPVHLTFIGDGPLLNTLRDLAFKLNVNCSFLGRVERERIPELLLQNDLFVLPSLHEGMSVALLEAMACGLPILATPTGSGGELTRGNGALFNHGDISALQNLLQEYIQDPTLREKHGRLSAEKAAQYSWKHVAKQYYDLYHDCLNLLPK